MFIYLMSSLIENLLIELYVYCYEIPVSSFVVLITAITREKRSDKSEKKFFTNIED